MNAWYAIAYTYGLVIINRMRFAFNDVSDDMKARNALISLGAVSIYFVLIVVVVVLQEDLPELGLTQEFFKQKRLLRLVYWQRIIFRYTTNCLIFWGFLLYILIDTRISNHRF